MSKVQAGPIQVPAGDANPHNNDLGKRKFQKSSTTKGLGPGNCPGGTSRSGAPLSWTFWSEIENLL